MYLIYPRMLSTNDLQNKIHILCSRKSHSVHCSSGWLIASYIFRNRKPFASLRHGQPPSDSHQGSGRPRPEWGNELQIEAVQCDRLWTWRGAEQNWWARQLPRNIHYFYHNYLGTGAGSHTLNITTVWVRMPCRASHAKENEWLPVQLNAIYY